jgi:hypothetical protein
VGGRCTDLSRATAAAAVYCVGSRADLLLLLLLLLLFLIMVCLIRCLVVCCCRGCCAGCSNSSSARTEAAFISVVGTLRKGAELECPYNVWMVE